LAPIGSIPLLIGMDGLADGILLDISGIGDLAWPAAADVLPDEPQAAATSATAATPTPALKAEPGRERQGDVYLDMGRPPWYPPPRTGTVTDSSKDAPYRRRRSEVDCNSSPKIWEEAIRRRVLQQGRIGEHDDRLDWQGQIIEALSEYTCEAC
jgi:hypothetical protein